MAEKSGANIGFEKQSRSARIESEPPNEILGFSRIWRGARNFYGRYRIAYCKKIQIFIKHNYLEMYEKWAEYSEHGFYGEK